MKQPPRAEIEWPPGSGRNARYSPPERRIVRDLTAAAREQAWSPDEIENQIAVLHELKIVFGVDLVDLTDAAAEAYEDAGLGRPRRRRKPAERS